MKSAPDPLHNRLHIAYGAKIGAFLETGILLPIFPCFITGIIISIVGEGGAPSLYIGFFESFEYLING
jgi:hypothetical protein